MWPQGGDEVCDRETWQLFLEGQGYRRVAPASFAKTLAAR
jgi:hypothetical protein